MTVVVLASHLPGEGVFRSERFEVVPVLCRPGEDFDYWAGYARWWPSDATIIGAEHDIELTDEHIAALLACEHDLCAQAYECHWVTTHLDHDVVPLRNGGRFVPHGTEWAEQSAIGLIKITPAARIGPLERAIWAQVEYSIEKAVSRPFHCHWAPELTHHHW